MTSHSSFDLRRNWRGFVVPLALVAAWAAASILHPGAPNAAAPVSAVARAAVDGFSDGTLPLAIASSVTRTLAGWSLAAVAGLAVGLGLGLSRTAGRMVSPTLGALRQIALFAWVPLLSAWLGSGEAMKIALIALGAFMPVALATEQSVRHVPIPYREVGRLLEFGPRKRLVTIILPAAMPGIMAGMELALTVAWIGTIGAEYLMGTGYMNAKADGLGVFLASAREYARMDRVIVGVAALALAGFVLNRGVVLLSRKLLSWRSH